MVNIERRIWKLWGVSTLKTSSGWQNPLKEKPTYLTQGDEEASFEILYLR